MTALEQAARDVDAYLQIDDDVLEFQHTGMVAVPIPRMVKLRKALRAQARMSERPHRCGREGCEEATVRENRTVEERVADVGKPIAQMCLACGVVADLAVHRCAGDEPVAAYSGPGYVGWMHTLGLGRLDGDDGPLELPCRCGEPGFYCFRHKALVKFGVEPPP